MSTTFGPRNYRNLRAEEQGERWRRAGGQREECWFKEGYVARRLWLRGWDQEDRKIRSREEGDSSLSRE